MKFLTVDIGTGTQDIYLYQSGLVIENGFKLVLPSPTMIIFRKIQASTQRGEDILLTGVTMGGGPSHWAARDHIQAGYTLYATPDAARSFDDDLDLLRESGVEVVSEDEAGSLPGDVKRIRLQDFDFKAIADALSHFEVSLADLAGVAVAVFDHGAAPPGYSDRQFRFDYLAERLTPIKEGAPGKRLSNLAFLRGEIPEKMTRLLAVEASAQGVDAPLLVMDTAPAAVLGAGLDPQVRDRKRVMIANLGNFHTLAFRLQGDAVEGVFEHHTGLIDREKMDDLLKEFAAGTLVHEDIFEDHGHGALIYVPEPYPLGRGEFDLVITGPRRNLMRDSSLRTYYAAPYGDMMLTGCFGLLAAAGEKFPEIGQEIQGSLDPASGDASGKPPWEIIN
jgi:uncharacterized protein (DUF1786 family)